jgi:hypothetical protein
VGCKGDLESERQVTDAEARDYALHIASAQYVLTSAKENTCVDDVFHLAAKAALDHASPKANGRLKNGKHSKIRATCVLQ